VASGYDAFISYSHALDRPIATKLQTGLHRFAKPWYRLRALRVFRDESSLSASPGLWPDVERSLSQARALILLASPEAAASHWVDREVAWWVGHRPHEGFLIVRTAGEIAWDNVAGDFSRSVTTALPPAAYGAFWSEPLHVDVGWARGNESLSGRDPRFQDAIATIAAPLRGQSKDDLIGLDRRFHRRAVRLARMAVASIVVLALGAALLAVAAVGQRNEARSQRDEAQRQSEISLARQVAAEATATASTRRDRSLLLALASVGIKDTVDGRAALATALRESDAVVRHLHPGTTTNAVAFSPDGTTIATAGIGEVLLWDAATGLSVGTLRHGADVITALVYSDDGALLASASSGVGDTVLWDIASRREVARLTGQPSLGLAFDRGGDVLVAARAQGGLAFWDVNRGVLLQPVPDDPGEQVTGIAFTGEGGDEIAASYNAGVVVAPLVSSTATSRLLPHPGATAVATSTDGTLLASGSADGSVQFWDVASATPIGEPLHLSEDVTELAFNRDGTILAASGLGTGEVALWEVKTHNPLMPSFRNTEGVSGLAFSPGGGTLVTSVPEGTVTLWDVGALTDGRQILRQEGSVSGLAINGDGSMLVSVSVELGKATIWDPGSRVRTAEVTPPGRPTGAVAADQGGAVVAVALEGGDVALWDVADQSFRKVALHHGADVTSLAFSADGLTLAAGSLDDTEVTLWHLDASNPWLGKIEESARVADLDLSSDGQLLAVAGLLEPTVRLWRVGSQPESIGELSDLPSVTSVSFSGDGRTVATGGGVQVLLWDVIALKRLGTPISRPTSIVTGVELAPDGHTVAVAGYRDLTVHEADSGRPLGESLRFADAVDATAMSGDGGLVAAGTDNGVIQLWSLSPESQKIRACEVANRELTDDEWLSLVPGRAPITLCGH